MLAGGDAFVRDGGRLDARTVSHHPLAGCMVQGFRPKSLLPNFRNSITRTSIIQDHVRQFFFFGRFESYDQDLCQDTVRPRPLKDGIPDVAFSAH